MPPITPQYYNIFCFSCPSIFLKTLPSIMFSWLAEKTQVGHKLSPYNTSIVAYYTVSSIHCRHSYYITYKWQDHKFTPQLKNLTGQIVIRFISSLHSHISCDFIKMASAHHQQNYYSSHIIMSYKPQSQQTSTATSGRAMY